jgi:catechol 2,3-dioxygenase-like lactoylglutathione lyase family enzyme
MIRGGNATIYVTDMDRSVSFYTETLGLRLAFRAGDHWASIDAGDGLQLGLHPASARLPAPGTVGAITVGLAVDEPIKLAFVTDPDGNEPYLAEPPHR